jgi:hypothetical protein
MGSGSKVTENQGKDNSQFVTFEPELILHIFM